jgi:DNA-binding NtrC family response regulator
VRELRNAVERAVTFAGGSGVTISDVEEFDDLGDDDPEPVVGSAANTLLGAAMTIPGATPTLMAPSMSGMTFQDAKQAAVDSFERDYLVRLFTEANCNLSEAARRSGVHRRYLRELFKKHGLVPAEMRAAKKG